MLLLNIGLHNNKKVVYHYRVVLLSVFNFSYLFFLAALKFLANLDSLSWGGVKKWPILRKFPKQSFSFQRYFWPANILWSWQHWSKSFTLVLTMTMMFCLDVVRNVIFFAQMLSFAWEEDIIIQLSCFLSSLRDLLNFLSAIAQNKGKITS